MKLLAFSILLSLIACSSNQKVNSTQIFEKSIARAIAEKRSQIKQCLPNTAYSDEIILYMNISGNGVISNITILPLTPKATQQCLSMVLSGLQFTKTDSKSYKIRHVIKL